MGNVELVILLPRLISLFPKICFNDEVRGIHKDFPHVSLGLKLPLEDVKNIRQLFRANLLADFAKNCVVWGLVHELKAAKPLGRIAITSSSVLAPDLRDLAFNWSNRHLNNRTDPPKALIV